MFTDFDPIPGGSSRLYVYKRDAGLGVQISVNGHALSALLEKEYVSVALPPGRYRLAAGVSTDIAKTECSQDPEAVADLRGCRRGVLTEDALWQP